MQPYAQERLGSCIFAMQFSCILFDWFALLALIMYECFCIFHIHSYEVAMESGPRNHVARHENQYHVPQLPRERDTVLHSDNVANYYSQYLPSATTSCISSQEQGLAPSYALPASSSTQQPLQSTYQSHYTPLIHENQGLVYNDHLQWSMLGTSGAAEAYVPVSARYSFAGAASTYQ